uniref:Uncharacterized protein n=1 Tax=Onchocerca volvulus TaxID=6282 RepID=A0A8R1XR12_ONCVO
MDPDEHIASRIRSAIIALDFRPGVSQQRQQSPQYSDHQFIKNNGVQCLHMLTSSFHQQKGNCISERFSCVNIIDKKNTIIAWSVPKQFETMKDEKMILVFELYWGILNAMGMESTNLHFDPCLPPFKEETDCVSCSDFVPPEKERSIYRKLL